MLTHNITIFWNGNVVLDGRCTVVMAYNVIQITKANFIQSRAFGDVLSLESFLAIEPGTMISGTIDDEEPGKRRTGQVHWRFTNIGD